MHPESVEAFWTSFDDICSKLSDIGHIDVCEEESNAKILVFVSKIKVIDFIVLIMFMKNIMYHTNMMCNTLQVEEIDVSGATEEMKIAYSSLNTIRSNTENLKNEVDAALAFAKSMDTDDLSDFNEVRRRRRMPKRFDENPDSTVVLDIYQYYSKEIIAVLNTMLSVIREKYENVESSFKNF